MAAAGQGAYEDATPDPLIDPLIARVNRPPQPVRATLISRLRDQVSLRLALMRHADESDERGSDATGAARHRAAHPPESAGPLSAALRARMDPHTGVDASTLPPAAGAVPARAVTGSGRPPTGPWVAAPPGTGATSGRGVRGAERGPAGPWTVGPPVRSATIAEEIPDSSDRQRVRDLDRGPRKPGRHTRQLGDRRWIGPSAGTLAPSSGRFGDLTHRVRHLAANTQRRYAALAILAILVVLVVTASLVLAHAGGQTLPLAGTGPTSHPAPAASATPALQSLPATVLQPSASVAPSVAPTVSATPVPTSVPTPVVATQTYGGAGTGWQLEDVRCCDVQAGTGYTRIVFDLGGASGADPTATVSFPTATTMVVTFTGVSAATSIEGDSGGGAVTGVNRESGSHVTFQLSLSHAVTIKGWDYFGGTDAESSAPLHLYFDLG